MAYMTRVFKSRSRMLLAGGGYVVAVYSTYFLLGMGIVSAAATAGFSTYFYWFAAVAAILAGLLEIKDYFWYGKGFSLQIIPGGAERIKKYTGYFESMETKHPLLSLALAFALGIFVVFVELPCTGAPYLAVLGMISAGDLADGVPLLLLYNLIFILPLLAIISLVYFGNSKKLEAWRKQNRGLMRLAIGLFLIMLGGYMIWSVT